MITNTYYQNCNTFLSTQPTKINKEQRKEKMIQTASGIGIVGLSLIGTGLASKSKFTKNISRKGLEFKNGVLVKKATGEAFSGKIKSNVGLIFGFNKIETRVFDNGIITEKTYKNLFGREKEGYFYKDGKECLDVFIKSQNIKTKNKKIATTWRSLDNSFIDTDGYRKGSVFEWARNLVKEEGWFNSAKFQENIDKWMQSKK